MGISVHGAMTAAQTQAYTGLRSARMREAKGGNFDRVTLSGNAKESGSEFARILAKKAVSQVLSRQVPEERVEELSRQVREGLYQPDPWAIAGRMLGLY